MSVEGFLIGVILFWLALIAPILVLSARIVAVDRRCDALFDLFYTAKRERWERGPSWHFEGLTAEEAAKIAADLQRGHLSPEVMARVDMDELARKIKEDQA